MKLWFGVSMENIDHQVLPGLLQWTHLMAMCQCLKGVSSSPLSSYFEKQIKESEKTLMKQRRNSAACKELFLTIFLSIFFFLMRTIVKVFIEFVTILLLLFMFWFLGCRACGILTPRPGIQPALHWAVSVETGITLLWAFSLFFSFLQVL